MIPLSKNLQHARHKLQVTYIEDVNYKSTNTKLPCNLSCLKDKEIAKIRISKS